MYKLSRKTSICSDKLYLLGSREYPRQHDDVKKTYPSGILDVSYHEKSTSMWQTYDVTMSQPQDVIYCRHKTLLTVVTGRTLLPSQDVTVLT